MDILLAIILGTLFGFVLHRIGAANPQNIINMLRLTDFHLMKTIIWGISLSSALLFLGLTLGIIDPSHLSVKSSYWGVIIGGAILGLGFAIAGYCPGTGLAGLGDGRKDARYFVIGGLFGAFVYMLVFAALKDTFLMKKIAGGKATLAATGNPSYISLIESVPGVIVALVISVIFFIFAWKLPNKTDNDS